MNSKARLSGLAANHRNWGIANCVIEQYIFYHHFIDLLYTENYFLVFLGILLYYIIKGIQKALPHQY